MAKPTAAEIEERLAQLERENRRYRKAFASSTSLILIAAPKDGRIVDVNETLAAATGYSREELVGRITTDLGLWKQVEDRNQVLATLRRDGVVRDLEVEMRTKAGNRLDLRLSVEMVPDPDEPVLIGIGRDVTQHNRTIS